MAIAAIASFRLSLCAGLNVYPAAAAVLFDAIRKQSIEMELPNNVFVAIGTTTSLLLLRHFGSFSEYFLFSKGAERPQGLVLLPEALVAATCFAFCFFLEQTVTWKHPFRYLKEKSKMRSRQWVRLFCLLEAYVDKLPNRFGINGNDAFNRKNLQNGTFL